jgi:hypothetical protein
VPQGVNIRVAKKCSASAEGRQSTCMGLFATITNAAISRETQTMKTRRRSSAGACYREEDSPAIARETITEQEVEQHFEHGFFSERDGADAVQ